MSKEKKEKAEQDLVALVKSRFDKGARAQNQPLAGWEECRLMYRGDQWLHPKGTKFVPASTPNWRVRLTVNKFIPIVESAISTYLKTRPIITATAGTDEDADIKASKISELLLRYYFEELEFDELNFDTCLWMNVTGTAYQRVRWDPTKGRRRPVVRETEENFPEALEGQEEGAEPEEEPEPAPEMEPVGQPSVDVISPFAMVIEPGAEKLENAFWCIVTEIMHRNDVESRWDVKLPEAASTGSNEMHVPIYIDRDSSIVEKERVAVHSMYERPSPKHPNGRIVHATKDALLGEEELPHGEIQIRHFRAIPLPGELYPTSMVQQGVPMQLELNRGRSQLVENRNLCSRPQVIAAFGAVEQESWDNRPGSIQHWDPIAARGIEPHYLSPPQIPQWVMSILQICEEDLMDLTSRHEVSQGSNSSNVTSGRQAAIYKGADDSRLTPSIRRFEKDLAQVGRWLLREAKDHLTGEQVIRIVGQNRRGEYYHFQSNDVSDNCNVRYEIASQLPWAKESQRQQIIYLNQIGKIDDATMFEMLEMPTQSRLYETDQQHKLNARFENQKLKEAYFPPMTTDNHAVHLREHEEEVNRPEYREQLIGEMQQQAAMMGEEAQIPGSVQAILNHMEAHRKLLPAPQAAPPMTRVNLNIERLITELAKVNPALAAQLVPYATDLMGDAAGMKVQGPQVTAEDLAMAPMMDAQQPGGEVGTPAGGMDGRMYQNPEQPEALPAEGEMYGGQLG